MDLIRKIYWVSACQELKSATKRHHENGNSTFQNCHIGLATQVFCYIKDQEDLKLQFKQEILPKLHDDKENYVILHLPPPNSLYYYNMIDLYTFLSKDIYWGRIDRKRIIILAPLLKKKNYGQFTRSQILDTQYLMARNLHFATGIKTESVKRIVPQLTDYVAEPPRPNEIAESLYNYIMHYWDGEKSTKKGKAAAVCTECRYKAGRHSIQCNIGKAEYKAQEEEGGATVDSVPQTQGEQIDHGQDVVQQPQDLPEDYRRNEDSSETSTPTKPDTHSLVVQEPENLKVQVFRTAEVPAKEPEPKDENLEIPPSEMNQEAPNSESPITSYAAMAAKTPADPSVPSSTDLGRAKSDHPADQITKVWGTTTPETRAPSQPHSPNRRGGRGGNRQIRSRRS